MNKKIVITYILNIPLTYIFICVMGWISYFIFNGNPTFFIPLRYLLCVYFILYLGMIVVALKSLKLNTLKMFPIMTLESVVVYVSLGILLHA